MAEKDPILSFAYNTKEEATKIAERLGCGGYRTYVIDGVKKYVPCDTVADFERALAIQINQGKIVGTGAETSSDRLVGIQLAGDTSETDALFTLGNFNITTSIPEKTNKAFVLPDSSKILTVEQLANTSISDLKRRLGGEAIQVNPDYGKFESFVSYGSLQEKIRVTIEQIAETFPAAIVMKGGSNIDPIIKDYSYDSFENVATFSIDPKFMYNPFNIKYTQTGETINDLRDFAENYQEYVLKYKGVEYPVIDFVAEEFATSKATVSIEGDPFNGLSITSPYRNFTFLIVPKKQLVSEFFEGLSDFGKFMLNKNTAPKYTMKFKTPIEDNNTGQVTYQEDILIFPTSDEHNIDLVSDNYETFSTKLQQIAQNFDDFKTNLVARFFTTDAFREYDTEDQKIKILLYQYGKLFDEVKLYIDGIANMTKVSYDKIDNIPDLLVKNFARTLGWKTFEIQNDDTIIQSLFKFEQGEVVEDDPNDITIGELDIELWRRLVINSAYLFKSKGTRRSIEFILKLVGVPESIIEINEYIYLAQNKLIYGDVFTNVDNINNHPIDTDGYPTVPPRIHFQADGGNIVEDVNNIGPYDSGKKYINEYTDFNGYYAFDLSKMVDNKKAWVNTSVELNRLSTLLNREADYTLKDSRLLINTKESEVYIALDRIFDTAIYRHYRDVVQTLNTNYSPEYTTEVKVSQLNFNQFLKQTLDNYINVRNRKTIMTYPTLSKIYYDYKVSVENLGKTFIEYQNALTFLNKFDTYWVKLVREFVPATTILTAGKKIQNSQFLESKHIHKRGINTDVDWVGTDGSEFQDTALLPVYTGSRDLLDPRGEYKPSTKFLYNGFEVTGSLNNNKSGYLNRAAYKQAYHYGFYDYCDFTSANILGRGQANKGSFNALIPTEYIITSNVVTGRLIDPSTTGITFYTQPVEGSNVYNDKILYGNQELTGNYDSTYFSVTEKVDLEIDDSTNSQSLRLTTDYDVADIGSLKKGIYFTIPNLTVENSTTYKLIYHYKFEGKLTSQVKVADFTLALDGGTITESKTTTITNDWKRVDVTITTNSTNLTLLFVSDGGIPKVNNSILVDKILIFEDTLSDFEEIYNDVGLGFICPPPLPHVCYSPTVSEVPSSGVPISLVAEYLLYFDINNDWTLIDVTSPVQINITSPTPTIGGNNGLIINTTGDENAGSIRIILLDDLVTSGSNYYFEYDMTATSVVTSGVGHTIRPILYKDGGTLADIIYYPETFTGGGRFFGEFINPISNASNYKFGLYITAGLQQTCIISKFKLIKKDIYRIGDTEYVINQPFNYGYSKSVQIDKPDNSQGGVENDWLVPYISLTGDTVNTGDVVGAYQDIEDRSEAEPIMHVKNSIVRKLTPTTNQDYVDINLTDLVDLGYVFFNVDNPDESIEPENNEIDGQIYQNDSLTMEFDGMYALPNIVDNNGPGPFYLRKTNEYTDNTNTTSDYEVRSLYYHITNDVVCSQGTTTPIYLVNDFLSATGSTFPSSTNTLQLETSIGGGHIYNAIYAKLSFEINLIFESEFTFNQDVLVKLVNEQGFVYVEEQFTLAGSENTNYETIDSRTIRFTPNLYFKESERIYVAVEPLDADCTILRSETETTTDYEFTLFDPTTTSSITGTGANWISNIAYAKVVTGDFVDDFFESGFMTNDEYTEITLTISERPDSIFPVELEEFTGYLVSYGKNKGNLFGGNNWSDDSTELYISTDVANRMDFYPYVPNKTHDPLNVDYTDAQSLLKFIGEYQQPIFTGYSYSYIDGNGDTQLFTGSTLTGNTITLRRFSNIKVYENDVISLIDDIKDNLEAFNTNLVMRPQFSGFSNGIGYNYAQDMFYNATDTSRQEVFRYGSIAFITKQNGVYLRYYFERDFIGYPRTGEFIGKILMKDICGNRAAIYLLFLVDLGNLEVPAINLQPTLPSTGTITTPTTGGGTTTTGGLSGLLTGGGTIGPISTGGNTGENAPGTSTGTTTGGGFTTTNPTISINATVAFDSANIKISGGYTMDWGKVFDSLIDSFVVNYNSTSTLELKWEAPLSLTFLTINGVSQSTSAVAQTTGGKVKYTKTYILNNVTTNTNINLLFS